MSNTPAQNAPSLKDFFAREGVQKKFEQLMGEKSVHFITSLLQVCNGNDSLAKADPATVYTAAIMAAALDLPINNNLGRAWIVPYGGKAQFQVGYMGLVELAHRSGLYRKCNAIPVYENQFESFNYLTEELKGDFTQEGEGDPIGYAAWFTLNNGFEKMVFWSRKKVIAHADKYSKTYNKKNQWGKLFDSPWNDKDQFDSMAMKTVLKQTLKKWGPLSIELQQAIKYDSATVLDADTMEPVYMDNEHETEDADHLDVDSVALQSAPKFEDLANLVKAGTPVDDLKAQYNDLPPDQIDKLTQMELDLGQ